MKKLLSIALAIALLVPAAPGLAEEPKGGAVFTQEKLEAALGPACDIVEKLTGRKFERRPTVEIAERETVVKALVLDFERIPTSIIAADERESTAKQFAALLLGKYDVDRHVIYIQPDVIEQMAELEVPMPELGDDELRVLMVHEVTHALDWPTLDWTALEKSLATVDAHQAMGAISEGHAQYVAKRAAKAWGIPEAFDRLTRGMLGLDLEGSEAYAKLSDAERAAIDGMLAPFRFAYAQGHAFLEAVAAARGDEGVLAVLRSPPTESRLIERPELYLAPPTAEEGEPIDLAAVVRVPRPLVEGDPWLVRELPVLRATLASQAPRVPESHRSTFLRGFDDARLLVGAVAEEQQQLVVIALRFDTTENAAHFVEAEYAVISAAKDDPPRITFESSEIREGAGTDGALPGSALYRELEIMGQPAHLRQQVFHVGPVAVEILATNIGALDAARIAFVSDAIAAFLRGEPEPETFDKTPLPRITKEYTFRVRGPNGEVPARALVEVEIETGNRTTTRPQAAMKGEVVIRVPRSATGCSVTARAASNADGDTLPWAASEPRRWPFEAPHLLQMREGHVLAGVLLDKDGQPAARRVIGAFETTEGPGAFNALRRDTTDGEGRFALRGLPEGTWMLKVLDADGDPWQGTVLGSFETGQEDLTLRVDMLPPGAFYVEVRDPDGVALEDFDVSIWFHRHGTRSSRALTSDGPRLRVVLPAGAGDVNVRATEARDAAGQTLPLAPSEFVYRASDADEVLEITMPRGRTWHGTLHDSAGEPLPDHEVLAYALSGDWWSRLEPIRVVPCNADGSFTFRGMAPGRYRITTRIARDEEWDNAETETQLATVNLEDGPLTLRMPALETFVITVLDDEGRPVEGASVQAHAGGSSRGKTDAQGRAELRGLDPDREYTLSVSLFSVSRKRDHALMRHDQFGWKPANTTVRLERGRMLRVRVLDAQGRNAARGRVVVRSSNGNQRFVQATGGREQVVRGLPPGPLEVIALPHGATDELHTLPSSWFEQVGPETDSVTVRIRDPDDMKTFELRVRTPEGAPIAKARAWVRPYGSQSGSSSGEGFTVENGVGRLPMPVYKFEVVVYDVRDAQGRGLPYAASTRGPLLGAMDFKTEITLEPSTVLEGVVRRADGSPIEGVELRALPGSLGRASQPADRVHARTRTGAGGKFSMAGLCDGPYWLHLAGLDDAPSPPAMRLEPGQRKIVWELAAPTPIAVVDAEDRPVVGASVIVRHHTHANEFEHISELVFEGKTTERGTVEMYPDDHTGGSFTLHVSAPEAGLLPVELGFVQSVPDHVRLQPARVLRGHVKSSRGKPVQGELLARVRREDGSFAPWSVVGHSDGEGAYETELLPRAPLQLQARFRATAYGDDLWMCPAVEVAAGTTEVDLTFTPHKHVLQLHLPGADKDRGGILVHEDGDRRAFVFDRRGRARVRGLRAGRYAAFVAGEDEEGPVAYQAGIDATQEEVRMTLVDPESIRIRVGSQPGLTGHTVGIRGPADQWFEAVPDGETWVVHGLPPGSWRVEASGVIQGRLYRGTARTTDAAVTTVELAFSSGAR